TSPPSMSKSPAAYSRSASNPLPSLRSTFSISKIPAPGPLLRTRLALRHTSPPVLFPFPGIAKPVPEKQTPLFPYFFPVFTDGHSSQDANQQSTSPTPAPLPAPPPVHFSRSFFSLPITPPH